VDLTIEDNFEGAASQDSLENSIDYSLLLATVQEIAGGGEFSLVETLAYKIVRKVLQIFPVKRVRVKVRKTPESLAGQIDYVEVDVEDC
jgi:dihydroneopterin aldolase